MSLNNKTREIVLQKYDGHCAYCGKRISLSEMQVDHFKPLRAWNKEDCGSDDISNLMPSCRRCNHYKRAHTLDVFRRYIEEIPMKLMDNYIYKVAIDYGLVEEHQKKVEFYFEKRKDRKHESRSRLQ